ncbi:major vault protein-like [Dysidea avara]|uniref:major vault protein-like n=1 Tax=Dysidea avara TaxID=196820 RepID=UPI0033194E45
MSDQKIVGIRPNFYVHVIDMNTNVTTLYVGPRNLMLADNQKLSAGPLPFVVIPPGHYCVVQNPIDDTKPIVENEQCELKFGFTEVRLHKEPFPLYPGESLAGASGNDYRPAIKKLPVVKQNHGIHLRALTDFTDDNEVSRPAGSEWQLRGPLSYVPRPEVEVVRMVNPLIIGGGEALRMRAKQGFTDDEGVDRHTGQEWLVRKFGAYLPGVYEELVSKETCYTLTNQTALHLRSNETHKDQFGKNRIVGDEWIVTMDDSWTYIPDVTEELVKVDNMVVLNSRQYCVVLDPVGSDGRPQLGTRVLKKGPDSFFLSPGEKLAEGIQNVFVLLSDEALLLTAAKEFVDITPQGDKVKRNPGDRWMISGPRDYVPPIEVNIIESRKAVALNKNEGIYVRDIRNGQVRAVMGPILYMLEAYEELFSKELDRLVEEVLRNGGGIGEGSIRKIAYFQSSVDPSLSGNKPRNKTRVVTYRCPGNTAVQVYNYQQKTARVVFGPDLVILGPHETFNVLNLSAGKPKKEGALHTFCLMLGHDYISDHITVETSDHARLKVEYSMNNYFEYESCDPGKLFSVPDFIGFACREIASRMRGMVASVPFEQFHKYSTDIVRTAVFGKDKEGQLRKVLKFPANNLVITNIDVQNIEPIDLNMRESLAKSVQMAIEIATSSIEASAKHEAKRIEQAAKGMLERQKLLNEKEAEQARNTLLELQSVAAAVESSGQAKAEAQAQAEKLLIEGQSAIELAELKAEAAKIELDQELESQEQMQTAEVAFQREQNELEIARAKELSTIEVARFKKVVDSIGSATITEIAQSGPRAQTKMLASLGIQSVIITDGHSPVNLMQTPQGIQTVIS